MENKKEMTIPNVSAATDAEQSLSKCTDNSIVNQDTDFKGYEQSFEEMQSVVVKHFCNTLFENSPGISSFKWCFPIIVGMRTDMIVPYVHISV